MYRVRRYHADTQSAMTLLTLARMSMQIAFPIDGRSPDRIVGGTLDFVHRRSSLLDNMVEAWEGCVWLGDFLALHSFLCAAWA